MEKPVNGVLETYELLENILSAVPMQQLFVLRRVSKAWKAMIQRSENLRKKMFLIADGTPLRPTASDIPWDVENHKHASKYDKNGKKALVLGRSDVRKFSESAGPTITFFNAPTRYSLQQEFPRGEWRRLLLTQPPVTALQVVTIRLKDGALQRVSRACTVYDPKGVRLRDLHAIHEKLCKSSQGLSSISLANVVFEFVLLEHPSDKTQCGSGDGGDAREARSKGCLCDLISRVTAEELQE